jgi:molybdate transport system ATP-binding protein
METPFITLDGITARLRDTFILPDTSWEILAGQHWAILGPNGAGKSTLVRVLTGDVPYVQGRLTYHFPQPPHEVIGYVAPELGEHLLARDADGDGARAFAGAWRGCATTRSTILADDHGGSKKRRALEKIADLLEIRHLLDRDLRALSAGEIRKALLARALIKSPRLLILDEPFAGLDAASREKLAAAVDALMRDRVQILFVTHRVEEIPPAVTNVLCVKNGAVWRQGKRWDVLTRENLDLLHEETACAARPTVNCLQPVPDPVSPEAGNRLVEMRDVTVKYGETVVLRDVNWTVRRGEHWAITGPNGAGKTTLLSLIMGDHPQAYANEVFVFGRRRGSGESIWEIKRRIGSVSAEFQTRYRMEITVRDVVASGLFDSIGLYRNLRVEDKALAQGWLAFFGISALAERIFTRLSYGERRLVLLARAMVKAPELLVLDEPCQGLDQTNRKRFLHLIDAIGSGTGTNILYVTHRRDELPRCIEHILRLPGHSRP